MPNVEDILEERQKTHGDFRAHSGLCQSLKRTCREYSIAANVKMTNVQWEAVDMILHKIARAVVGNANHIDHWADIQGYAKLVSNELQTPAPDAQCKINEDGTKILGGV